jgi:GT2 family glycosyltransferase
MSGESEEEQLVSIIVLNWNGKHLLGDCLDSIKAQTYPHIEIIVIDNGSVDGSIPYLEKNYTDVKLIVNESNLGFSRGMNIGFKEAKGNYLMPLNNDIRLEPNFVEEMVKAAQTSDVGSVSGKLIKADSLNRDIIDSAGHVLFKNRLVRNRGAGLHVSQLNKEEYVFGACGAAPLYKREMLEDVAIDGEYYDEDFFSFFEDVDLDWRAQIRGWKCKFTPKAIAYHWRGGTAVRRTTIVEKHNYKNRYLLMLKNDTAANYFKNLPWILFTDIIKSSALLFRAPVALTGWFSIIRLFPQMLKKRRHIQGRRKVSAAQIERLLEKFDYKSWIKKHLREDAYNLRK